MENLTAVHVLVRTKKELIQVFRNLAERSLVLSLFGNEITRKKATKT